LPIIEIIIIDMVLSFIITYKTVPILIKKFNEKGIVGLDLHRNKYIANAGGVSLFIGFSTGIILCGFLNIDPKSMLTVILVSILAFILGFLDDILVLSKKALITWSLVIGMPFLSYKVGSTIITLTPIGPVDLGYLFWPIAVLSVAFLSNAVNIYAGFNGLEAGLGLITSLSLAICAFIYGSIESALSLLILASSLVAFLKYNFYPAKIFIGNSGTYMIGAIIASSIIVGTIKTVGIIACMPYIINFFIRLYDRMRWTVGENTPDGKVYCSKMHALWCIFMYKKPITEKKLVLKCWGLQLLFGLLAILYALKANSII